MIEKENYQGYKIYFPTNEKNIESILKKICDKDYKVLEIYKDTERNYVAKIQVADEVFILKSPKAETVIPQRRVQTIFKKGEALTTFINLTALKEKGLDFFAKPYGAIVKKNIFIEESFLLMEYIQGEALRTCQDIDKVMEITKKLHKNGIYHGDLNTSNFIKIAQGIKVLDTQGKSEKYFNYFRAYDILTLKQDLLTLKLGYNVEDEYKKDMKTLNTISYYFANFVKNFKRVPIIQAIRGLKQKLREKGWKI